MKKHNQSILILFLLMVPIIFAGVYARSLQHKAVRDTWLDSQSALIQQGNKNRVLENQLKQTKDENVHLKKIISLPPVEKMALKVRQYFSDDFKTALMVFKDESGLNPSRMNWNCYYGPISMACKSSDHHLAWSVDCGLTMINVLGQVCPQELFDPDTNLRAARRKYEARGFEPWVVYWTGRYVRNEDWFAGINQRIASL